MVRGLQRAFDGYGRCLESEVLPWQVVEGAILGLQTFA